MNITINVNIPALEDLARAIHVYSSAIAYKKNGQPVDLGEPPQSVSTKTETKQDTSKVEKSVAKKDMYFYHPESDSYWMLPKGEEIPTGIDFGHSTEITKNEYEKGIKKNDQVGETENTSDETTEEDQYIPTVVELRAKAQEKGDTAEGKKAIKALLDKFNSKSISNVPEKDRAAFLSALEAL